MRLAAMLAAWAASAWAQAIPAAQATSADLMRAAAEKQRAASAVQHEAAVRQAQAMGLRLKPWHDTSDDLEADCDRVDDSVLGSIVESAARDQGLDGNLLRAVIEQESGFRPCAVSAKGAQGLMQLMPATAAQFGATDPFDPAENVAAGAKYLKQLMTRYNGDIFRALSAYNAGPSAVDQAGGVPLFPETLGYLGAILEKLGR
jgi:soluble lytic murein transglycosylase-like protein